MKAGKAVRLEMLEQKRVVRRAAATLRAQLLHHPPLLRMHQIEKKEKWDLRQYFSVSKLLDTTNHASIKAFSFPIRPSSAYPEKTPAEDSHACTPHR